MMSLISSRKRYLWAGCSDIFLVFSRTKKRSGRKQRTAMSLSNKHEIKANFITLPEPLYQESSPSHTDLQPILKLISSKGNITVEIWLAASDVMIAFFRIAKKKGTQKELI